MAKAGILGESSATRNTTAAHAFARAPLERMARWQQRIVLFGALFERGMASDADWLELLALRAAIESERGRLKELAAPLPGPVAQHAVVVDLFRALDAMAIRIDRMPGTNRVGPR